MNDFNTVRMVYPNEWRKNISELGVEPEVFNWFLCSKKIYDDKTDLFYISVSPDVQFFNEHTGETLLARGLKNDDGSVRRVKLLILSEPHNKMILCKNYKILCGCTSEREVLSTECDLVTNYKLLEKTSIRAVELGYDGAVVKHDCMVKCLDCVDNPICQNAMFIFKIGALKPIKNPERCGIVKYARKHNSFIRKKIKIFPTVDQINIALQKENCENVSLELYNLINRYMRSKSVS